MRVVCNVGVFLDKGRAVSFGADSKCYNQLAKSMVRYKKFSTYSKENYTPEPARPPGYPFFLFLIYKLCGIESYKIVVGVQVVIDCFTLVVVYLLLKTITTSQLIPLIGSVFYSVHLHQALYTTQLLSESLFTLVLILGIFFLVKFNLKTKKRKVVLKIPLNYTEVIVSALFLGVACYIRAISLFLPLILVFFVTPVRPKIIFLGTFLVVILPWIMRNYLIFGRIFFVTIGEMNLLEYSGASIIATVRNIKIEEARKQIWEEMVKEYNISKEESEKFGDLPHITKLMSKKGFSIIRKYPKIYLIQHLVGFFKTFIHQELGYWGKLFYGYKDEEIKKLGNISQQVLYLGLKFKWKEMWNLMYTKRFKVLPCGLIFLWMIMTLYQLFLYFTGIRGVKKLKKTGVGVLFFLAVVFYFSFLPGVIGDGRFRVPIEPYLVVFSAFGIKRE